MPEAPPITIMMGSWTIALAVAMSVAPSALHVQDGDIIFHTSRSSQSLAIQRATHSPYSHMGLTVPIVKTKLRQRHGSQVPLNEVVISPAAMFAWSGLVTVVEE
jgi:hypothetical protein